MFNKLKNKTKTT